MRRLILIVAQTFSLASLFLVLSGCATTDDASSERPWNTPRSWENGLPGGMMPGSDRRF